MTPDTGHMTHDMWHMTHDMWHMDEGWTFSKNVSFLSLTVWEEKADSLTKPMSNTGVCRKAPAIPGLLITVESKQYIKSNAQDYVLGKSISQTYNDKYKVRKQLDVCFVLTDRATTMFTGNYISPLSKVIKFDNSQTWRSQVCSKNSFVINWAINSSFSSKNIFIPKP